MKRLLVWTSWANVGEVFACGTVLHGLSSNWVLHLVGWEVVQILLTRVGIVGQDALVHNGDFVELSYPLPQVTVILIHQL